MRISRGLSRGGIGVLAVNLAFVVGIGCGIEKADDLQQTRGALGSTEGQQTIGNWTQLTQMTSTGNYLLTTNINAAGKTWTIKDFSGTFDGGGHTISNLTVNTSTAMGGFFGTLNNAIVKNVRFLTLTVSGQSYLGGVAGYSVDSLIQSVGVEGNINGSNAIATGGLLGEMSGGQIIQSYAKGSVNGSILFTGGLTGFVGPTSAGAGQIYQSYAWETVTADTSVASRLVYTGGIVGLNTGSVVQEVYAVGNVTGRGYVGGLVGSLGCDGTHYYVLNHGLYRGDVVDKNLSSSGGWSGTFGTFDTSCIGRFDQLIWDKTLDASANTGAYLDAQKSALDSEMMSPTTVTGGVYHYDDNTLQSATWNAGTASQHHALQNMPGGLTIQPRCMVNGVPTAC